MVEWQLFINGVSKKKNSTTHKINIKNTDTIKSLILSLTNTFGFNQDQFYLSYGTHILYSDYTLEECGIVDESTIHLNFKLLSCKEKCDTCR